MLLAPACIGDGFARLAQLVILLGTRAAAGGRAALLLTPARGRLLEPCPPSGEVRGRCRIGVLLDMELRGGAAIVDPRHLPREPAEIGGGLGRDING